MSHSIAPISMAESIASSEVKPTDPLTHHAPVHQVAGMVSLSQDRNAIAIDTKIAEANNLIPPHLLSVLA